MLYPIKIIFMILALSSGSLFAQDYSKSETNKNIELSVYLRQLKIGNDKIHHLIFEEILEKTDKKKSRKIKLSTGLGLVQLNLKVGEKYKLFGKIEKESATDIELSEALVYFSDSVKKVPLWVPSIHYSTTNQVQKERLIDQHRPETDYVVF